MQIAKENRYFRNGVQHVRLPRSAVLYLRHRKRMPDQLHMVIEDGDQKIIRSIPAAYILEQLSELERSGEIDSYEKHCIMESMRSVKETRLCDTNAAGLDLC